MADQVCLPSGGAGELVKSLEAKLRSLTGKKNRKARDKVKRKLEEARKRAEQEAKRTAVWDNYIAASCPGCHVAHCLAAIKGDDTEDGGRDGEKDFGSSAAEAGHSNTCAVSAYAGGQGGAASRRSRWFVDVDDFYPEDFGLEDGQEVPDVSLDPDTQLLTVINPSEVTRSIYVTVGHPARNVHGEAMTMGWTRDEEGKTKECITLVLVVGPRKVVDVCYVDLTGAELPPDIRSDIKDLPAHPAPDAFDPAHVLPVFPLGTGSGGPFQGPFQCTQGMGGCFTHFFPGTFHAVDFGCPVGTPVLAVADGVVTEVLQTNHVSGIHVRNLFLWNSITIKVTLPGGGGGETSSSSGTGVLAEASAAGAATGGDQVESIDSKAAVGSVEGSDNDTTLFVEYVHIRPGSVRVEVGQTVAAGDVLCESGDVGFCPEPHLHIQAHTSDAKDAPTVKVAWRVNDVVHDEDQGETEQGPAGGAADGSGGGGGGGGGGNGDDGSTAVTKTPPAYYFPLAGHFYNHAGEAKQKP